MGWSAREFRASNQYLILDSEPLINISPVLYDVLSVINKSSVIRDEIAKGIINLNEENSDFLLLVI